MRILAALSILQTLGIGAILLLTLQERSPQSAVTHQPTLAAHRAADKDDHSSARIDARLREIAREEIAAAANRTDTPSPPTERSATTENIVAREQVAEQIELYRSVGAIDDAQMQELQSRIAALPDPDRQRMMSALIRAMNAGEIDGRL